MAYLRLDYLPLTGSRRSYYLYVCLCATACARTCTRSLVSPRLLAAWCLRGPFKAGTAMKGGEEKRGDGGKGGCMRMVNERESSRL